MWSSSRRGFPEEQIQDSAVAFSNARGGVILVGVRDDGDVAGRVLDAGTEDDIHQALQAARDIGRYGISQVDVEGRGVCVISIARRREGFAQSSKGVVKVRRGTRDDPLFGTELVVFATARTMHRYELVALDAGLDVIDPGLRASVARTMGWTRATPGRLRDAHLVDGDRLTVVGALYLTGRPDELLGKAFVELQRFSDDDTIDYDQRREIRGSLPQVLTSTVEAILEALGSELVVLGTRSVRAAALARGRAA